MIPEQPWGSFRYLRKVMILRNTDPASGRPGGIIPWKFILISSLLLNLFISMCPNGPSGR